MKRAPRRRQTGLHAAVMMLLSAGAATSATATDVARTPLSVSANARPNVIFGMDNSGSMDNEVLLSGTNDGAFWWNPDAAVQSGWAAGRPLFGGSLLKYNYLFPDGCGPGRRNTCESFSGPWAIAPTAQLASLRSSAYNPLYYDPSKTYLPWAAATIDASPRSWAAVLPHAAPADPFYPYALPLDVDFASTDSNFTFHMAGGMVVPQGARRLDVATGAWVPVAAAYTVPAGTTQDISITYYPATYWVRATCSVDGIGCATAPDGATLQRIEIKPGVGYPSGRAYAAELQNFANWFTYYRKRRLMLAASMGTVMNTLTGVRAGVVDFNGRTAATMYDTDATDPTANGRVLTGHFQTNAGQGGTPTRATLAYIGEQFRTNRQVVTSSCQRNAVIVVTDGFAEAVPVAPPAYTAATWGAAAPYATTWRNSLADIALSYYTNDLRPDLLAGQVGAASANDPNPAADRNPDPHMNTYAITLGAVGYLWPARTDAYAGTPPAWPNPDVDRSPTAIDDLWHATVNGRGMMLTATNPDDTAAALKTVLADIVRSSVAQSGVAFGNPTLSTADAVSYLGSYRLKDGSGDVTAHAVDARTGAIAVAPLWSADALVTAADWHARRIFSFDGTAGVAFTAAAVGSLLDPGAAYGGSAALVDYLRGDRTGEGAKFRSRGGLMGADIDAEVVVDRVQAVVYGTTNDGMVHALDKASGQEIWAYVPGFGLSSVGARSQPAWSAQTVLDATPTLATAGGRRLLVGGRGSAGPGFYALDVGQSRGLGEAQLAARAMWEFPGASSASPQSSADQVRASIGLSVGRPLIVFSASYGWVVLVTSGYNSSRDGRGRLFVLDALTGTVRREIATPAGALGSVGAGEAGLAQVSGFVEPGGTVRRVYGGDLLGNLWRFDIDAGTVQRVATLVDARGAPLPVTAAPELGTDEGRRMVYVGTGRLLGASDLADDRVNSFYAIRDDDSIGADLRPVLAPRTLAPVGGTSHVVGQAVDWATQRGWYIDLPAGEKAHTDPVLALGVLTWTTNRTSLDACLPSSVLYVAAAASGLELPPGSFPADAYFSVKLAPTLASRSAVARLSDGNLVVATQQSDGATTQHRLLVPTATSPRRTGWREIRR